jgi:fluoride exporter
VSVLLWLGVALVSGTGALLRFALQAAVWRRLRGSFPAGTLVVNVAGSLVLGVLHGAGVGGDAGLLLATALLGSFTTFSTWMVESERLAASRRGRIAAANIGFSLALGLAAVALGWATGSLL